jgi:glycosyltransferase involved in cell wall biosynthesis
MIYFVYPRLRKLSGAERLILRLASYTVRLGASVTLVTHYFDARCAPALASNVSLSVTGDRLEFVQNHYLNAPFEYFHSLRLLNAIGADAEAVVFFGPPSLPALAWHTLTHRAHPPLLYFCYEPPRFAYDDTTAIASRLGPGGFVLGPLFQVYKYLDRAMVRRADGLLANSHFGAARLKAAYQRAATVITHGADFATPADSAIRAVRKQYELDGKFVLLTVNFLHPRKRLDLLLHAFAELHAQVPNAVALVVGAGPERVALAALSRELQVAEAVHWTGFLPDEDLPAYYAASDVYMHTGKLESFGLSVLEASASGLPVVTVDEGGPREIVAQNETGLLVEATAQALANAARDLANDPERRVRMGNAGRQRAAALYSWERGARELLTVVDGFHTAAAPLPAATWKPG